MTNLEKLLEHWVNNIGNGPGESDVALLAIAVALEKVASALTPPRTHGGE